MRSGEPKTPTYFDRSEAIAQKCHPAIFEVAGLLKESVGAWKKLQADRSPKLMVEIREGFHAEFERIRRKYPEFGCRDCGLSIAPVIFGDASPGNTSGWGLLADLLHWERYWTPLRVDLRARESGDWKATRRVLQTVWECERIRCGQKSEGLKFKGDTQHHLIFEMLWGLGVERLTAEELADFFNGYCPCGKEHSADGLKKQRARFQRLVNDAPDWTKLSVEDWLARI